MPIIKNGAKGGVCIKKQMAQINVISCWLDSISFLVLSLAACRT